MPRRFQCLSSLKKEFHKETEIVKQAKRLLEAQSVWESIQRSSLFRAEVKVTNSENSVDILSNEAQVTEAASIVHVGSVFWDLDDGDSLFPFPGILPSSIPYLGFHKLPV